jgi:flagellar L-ring protein precursor FlgH
MKRLMVLLDRRTVGCAYIFIDTRARRVGDLVTIAIAENTGIDNKDQRDALKGTKTGGTFAFKGNIAGTSSGASRQAAASLDALTTSQRNFSGSSTYNVAQNFSDRITATVIAVLPNGNLVVEGSRTRVVGQEVRTLVISGVVRPVDISPTNTVQSQYLGNFQITYRGQGDQSAFSNQGWFGQFMNKVWPF